MTRISEVLPGLSRVEVPLPGSPLKAVNSYVLEGDRCLVVDTGMNRPECLAVLRSALTDLGVDPAESDFFVTHFHADHLGLVGEIAGPGSRIYLNRPEAEFMAEAMASRVFLDGLASLARKGGFSESEIQESLRKHPGLKYSPKSCPRFTSLREGDRLSVGEFSFECVATPGHTMGHQCLHDPRRKLLISGDHVLGDITPNIAALWDERNPLKDYLASLDKVARLDVNLVLPGHREPFGDLPGRVGELKRHHEQRLDEVRGVLEGGGKTAYEVASEMSWDIAADTWEAFPVVQKWFAVGEAATHLRYLQEAGDVVADIEREPILFQLS